MKKLTAVLLGTSVLCGCASVQKAPIEALGLAVQAVQPFNAILLAFNGIKFYLKSSTPETKSAKAKGTGATKEIAVNNALRNVVQQSIGTMIVTETEVEKDKLVRDLSLAYSSGVVESYEIVGCVNGKEYECEVSALVSTGTFHKTLLSSSKVVKINGSDVHAQQITLKNSLQQQNEMAEYHFSKIRKVGLEPKIKKVSFVPLGNHQVQVVLDYEVEWKKDFKKSFVTFLQKLEKDTEKLQGGDEIYLQWAPSGMFSNRVIIKTVDSDFKNTIRNYQYGSVFVKIDELGQCIEHKMPEGVVNLENVVIKATTTAKISEKMLQKMQKLSISTDCQKT